MNLLSTRTLLFPSFTQKLQPSSTLSSFNLKLKPSPPSSASSLSTPSTTTNQPKQPLWPQFADRVSGEWDGFCAEFSADGSPIELPDNVVPEAFREWEVPVFDWQTQCPTLAQDGFLLTYKLIKLLPTVGCEADAATMYSVEERVADRAGDGGGFVGLGYDASGSYVGVWGGVAGGRRVREVEHCLVDPRGRELRVRVVMVVEEETGALAGFRVFSEGWDGPWRNGEQMGGCAVREAGFALSARVEIGDVAGVWEEKKVNVARFDWEGKVSIQL